MIARVLPLVAALALPGAAPAPDSAPALEEVTLRVPSGLMLRLLNWGATVTAIELPDGQPGAGTVNLVLGYGTAAEYPAKNHKNGLGATIGRYAGRIADARFTLDGRPVTLRANDGRNALHGGGQGFDARPWYVRRFREGTTQGAEFTTLSADGDQGFPGALSLSVTYRLRADDSIRIDYLARTTKPTAINLTNHSYFNLAGQGTVTGHLLRIPARRYAATDAGGIPTGALPAVAATPLDFRRARAIGERIDSKAPPMTARGGYNHAWMLEGAPGAMRTAAVLVDPGSGRRLTVTTTEPSLQAYTGDYFDGQDVDAKGRPLRPRDGIALETQHLSDSPNRPAFPSTILRPGETFRSTTLWRFDRVPRG